VIPEVAACPACNAISNGGRYCRGCGAALGRDASLAREQPPPDAAAAAPPQPPPAYQQPMPDAAPPVTVQIFPPGGHGNGWGYASVAPPTTPLPQVPHWLPLPVESQQPRRTGTAFAVGGMIAIVLVMLAVAATIILLVASGGSNHTGILTQSIAPAGKSEQSASP
jgi:hypothetical protein